MTDTPLRVWTRNPYPLGATWMEDGVNFALFSEHATQVDLCLFEEADSPAEYARIPLPEQKNHVWHGFFPDLKPGQVYGFRVEGPYDPSKGHRFNARKLLLDPYAKAIAGKLKWDDALFGYAVKSDDASADVTRDERDSAPFMPKAVVIDPAFDWEGTDLIGRSRSQTIVYEVHVKGFSQQWEEIPPELRGTYSAIASEPAIAYFKRLGVTAIELLPIHQYVDDRFLVDHGKVNYWGYNTIGYFAPEPRYSSQGDRGGQVNEFKAMVKKLHQAGLEVILDVVYNHTAEGNRMGPTLSFRGIDNANYYRLKPEDPRYYIDFTGCGNSLQVPQQAVLQLVLDSLRYWVTEMKVDGFRFDLASTLAREYNEVSRLSAFFTAIHQDPVLSRVKLIAEPWDVGDGGYQVGNLPVLWSEWNGKYRDTIREWWKGNAIEPGLLALRLSGSPDLYQLGGRRPTASVNFITAHDGFTLRDLVSYNDKHNLDNGEGNRDGDNSKDGWNCGAEGPTDDPAINALRRRQQRNFLATLYLSQGMPMLSAGDEYGRTQNGNNNAYCQDSGLSWLSWRRDEEAERLTNFVGKLAAYRLAHPIFHRSKFFAGRQLEESSRKDLTWIDGGGQEITGAQWHDLNMRTLGMMFCGDSLDLRDERGEPIRDDTFLLWFNGYHLDLPHLLPGTAGVAWEFIFDTAEESGFLEIPMRIAAGETFLLGGRSVVLLRQVAGSDEQARGSLVRTIRGRKAFRPGAGPGGAGRRRSASRSR